MDTDRQNNEAPGAEDAEGQMPTAGMGYSISGLASPARSHASDATMDVPVWAAQPVAWFASCRHDQPEQHPAVREVLTSIKNPSKRLRAATAQIRFEADKGMRDQLKQGLPAVTFAAALLSRARDVPLHTKVGQSSALCCLEFDHVPDPDSVRWQPSKRPDPPPVLWTPR